MKKMPKEKKKTAKVNYPCRVALTKEAHAYLSKIAGDRGGKSHIASEAILAFK